MNICIIGAGWFGCHIACKLIEDGHKVKIFEKESTIFLMLQATIKTDFI